MLFLAVFCGFLAEYQLEHKIEKEKGKQYIISFYEDLKTDTVLLEEIIRDYENKVKALKQIEPCYQAINRQNKPDTCLYNLFIMTGGFNDLVYTDRTLQQLKNAGGLRLLLKEDADSILIYDNSLRMYIKIETTAFQEIQYKVRDMTTSILHHQGLTNPGPNTVLYGWNPETINKYFNLLYIYNNYCQSNLQEMIQIKSKAISLLEYFKRKYHLN
jgi:hypothetical protein